MRSSYGTCLESLMSRFTIAASISIIKDYSSEATTTWYKADLIFHCICFQKEKKTSNELTSFRNLIDRYTPPIASTTCASAVAKKSKAS